MSCAIWFGQWERVQIDNNIVATRVWILCSHTLKRKRQHVFLRESKRSTDNPLTIYVWRSMYRCEIILSSSFPIKFSYVLTINNSTYQATDFKNFLHSTFQCCGITNLDVERDKHIKQLPVERHSVSETFVIVNLQVLAAIRLCHYMQIASKTCTKGEWKKYWKTFAIANE